MPKPKMTRGRWPRGTWMKLTSRDVLKVFMNEKGVSLQDLARAADVSKGFISHLTSGRRSSCTPQVAVQIARRLEVPLEILFVPSVSTDSATDAKQQRGKAA